MTISVCKRTQDIDHFAFLNIDLKVEFWNRSTICPIYIYFKRHYVMEIFLELCLKIHWVMCYCVYTRTGRLAFCCLNFNVNLKIWSNCLKEAIFLKHYVREICLEVCLKIDREMYCVYTMTGSLPFCCLYYVNADLEDLVKKFKTS